MVISSQWLINKTPQAEVQLSGSDATFKLSEADISSPSNNGELLVKARYFSNDPAQRRWIAPAPDPSRLYTSPVVEGDIMRARALCEVVESKSSKFQKGDWVLASCGWTQYDLVKDSDVQPAQDLPGGLNRTHYLGALGLTGLTAYCGLTEVAHANKDDIVVVSGAAGATGSMVVQIAKKIIGCKTVIGIAGTDDKCKWVQSIGADSCLNYKSSSFAKDLEKALPSPKGFATVYFDNVGGDILDLMLTRMAQGGRIAACGAISNYDKADDKTIGIKNWFEVVSMRIQVSGFIVLDFMDKWPAAIDTMRQAVADGKLQVEGGESVVKTKWEDVPKTWMQLFSGGNQGKLVTEIV